jgi:hypothetical protein
MITIDPKSIETAKLQGYLQSSVGPRLLLLPVRWMQREMPMFLRLVSLIFSANPPILIFRQHSVRDNSIKHTLINAENWEVVINVVIMIWCNKFLLASTEYADGVDEFVKSGLTPAFRYCNIE